MDKFLTQKNCDRCGGSLEGGRIMSMLNVDCICMECKRKEREKDNYREALDTVREHERNGEMNFEGIGFK